MKHEIVAFIIGIPAMVVDKGVSLHNAYAYLCPELCLYLALDYRSYEGLVQADDPVLAYIDMIDKHFLLLFPHLYRGEEQAAVTRLKREEVVAVNPSEDFKGRVDIPSKAGPACIPYIPGLFPWAFSET